MKNRRKAVQPFEIKKRKIDIFRNYEANGFEKNQRKFENFSTLISKKSKVLLCDYFGNLTLDKVQYAFYTNSIHWLEEESGRVVFIIPRLPSIFDNNAKLHKKYCKGSWT